MSFGSNKSNQKQSTNSVDNMNQNTTFNQTSTPVLPDWVSQQVQGQAGADTALAGADPRSFIAGATPLLQTAANSAGDLTGTPWAFDGASDATRGVINSKAPSVAANIQQFMDPYLSSVVDATSADLDHSDGLARARDDLGLAASGAFGGSGAALTKAATEGELARARATTLGGLRSAGYGQALGGAENQAQLSQNQQQIKLAGAAQLANLGSQYEAGKRADIATQDAAAAPIQQIAQATAQAPIDFQTALTNLLQGLPLNLFAGQNQQGTENQVGTETQTGTNKGTGTSFGFKLGGK